MNENEAENEGRNRAAEDEAAEPPQGTLFCIYDVINGILGGNNQQRSTGDIILQVHIANIFLTFCQRYACLCNRKVRRGLEFIVLLKVTFKF